MATITLILPLEAMTVSNTSDSRSDSGVIAGGKVKLQLELWQSKMDPQTQL